MKSGIAISVQNVKKDFRLTGHKSDSIKTAVTQVFKSKNKNVDTHHALKDISLEIKTGEFFGILGRNGSGKSTLLKIISEIYKPTSGHAKHRGRLVSFIELGVGFKGELSGRENVFLNGALLGFSKNEIKAMYDDIVSFAELEKFMEQKLKNYSSGMKVRLAFSVAIRAKADILILDEVLAVGDAAFKKKCSDYFRTLKDSKKTVVLVTHGMKAVREFCNRAIVIEDGNVAFEGTGEEAANEYLKLFKNDGVKIEKAKKQGKRWGDKGITIQDFNVELDPSGVKVTVTAEASDQPVDDAVFGFRIKSEKGRVLIGANSLNATEGRLLRFEAHEVKNIVLSFPNLLSNKSYTVSATINSKNGKVTHDWWEDIVSIKNERESSGRYPLVAPAKLTVK